MSLLRPGVIKQHKPNQTYIFNAPLLAMNVPLLRRIKAPFIDRFVSNIIQIRSYLQTAKFYV